MKTLIVSGCSVTHGAEIYNGFMHPNNIQGSYSKHLSDALGVTLKNVALSGCDNAYIFHSLVEAIDQTEHIHSVIVAWTSVNRISWQHQQRHWFFVPSWASSVENLEDFHMHGRRVGSVWLTSDCKSKLDELEHQHRFFVENYMSDTKQRLKELKNYSQSIRAICQQKQVKLVELSAWPSSVAYCFDRQGQWRAEGRHPNVDEHQSIAKEILQRFYTESEL